jgi:hypothetical protein
MTEPEPEPSETMIPLTGPQEAAYHALLTRATARIYYGISARDAAPVSHAVYHLTATGARASEEGVLDEGDWVVAGPLSAGDAAALARRLRTLATRLENPGPGDVYLATEVEMNGTHCENTTAIYGVPESFVRAQTARARAAAGAARPGRR